MKNISIFKGERVVNINESYYNGINDLLIGNKLIRIEMNKDTFDNVDMISKHLNYDYHEYYAIVPDLEFGRIKIIWSRGNNTTDFYTTLLLCKETIVDTYDLDRAISIESPTFLIMSRNTLSILIDKEDCDMFCVNDKACYHSYRKVIIAISEFIEPGVIFFDTK